VRFADGSLHGDGRALTLRDAAHLAEARFGPLVVSGAYNPPRHGSRFRRQSVGPSPAYSFTAQVAEVAVDLETGEVAVERVWVAHDCGRALNPTIVEGQVEGCVYMGVGEAILEEQSYRDGVLRAPSLLEYRVPTVHETPEIHVQLVESVDAEGPFGAKECGEGPQLGTVPAIANAIHDATGAWLTSPPYTPDRVLRALNALARGGA
jgi:CO/xanthine dehydrogenase Mo-binding subunit